MGLGGLLGAYDSDEERPAAGPGGAAKAAPEAESNPTVAPELSTPSATRDDGSHGPLCSCEDCELLLARFAAKSLQTKGIRFKCKLCGEAATSKAATSGHFKIAHADDLQAFKQKKEPGLFRAAAAKRAAASPAVAKISFARDDVLRKRSSDDDVNFGGWAKKAKPEPPPCETAEYQAMMEPVFTTVPWANKSRPTNEDATEMDLEVDRRISEAQMRRFCKRNTLEVNSSTVRCKLCYKTIGSVQETERHIAEAHQDDFRKEMQIWERFLYTTCRRQPPFGWVCKVCSIFFPSDGSVWRHLGKEVFIRHEERHLEIWHQKEDRWGHEEDEECCGDGLNYARGLSYDSVRKLNEEAKSLREAEEAKATGGPPGGDEDEDDEEEEEQEPQATGDVKFISEF